MNDTQLLEQEAVNAAIRSNWTDAIELNKKILDIDSKNIDSLLRLGFIYMQMGEISDAKKHYLKAFKLQPSNLSVAKNLEKIKILESKKIKSNPNKVITLNPYLFIEVPGKTKMVPLVNPGQKNILAQLTIGQEVILIPKKRKVEIRTKTKDYVGSLPDDISKRLSIFIKAGSEFSTYIKEASLNMVIIFIKEEKKGKKVLKFASFPANFQVNISEISQQAEEATEEEMEEPSENDLEKLAEALGTEDKEFVHFNQEDREEDAED
ncbi:MAG: tetratricopeptide repeat protein [bacterium]|nr:tetratricopeptide repeat protein [bacterium]